MCKSVRWEWCVSMGGELDECEEGDVRAYEDEGEDLCVLQRVCRRKVCECACLALRRKGSK